MSNSFSDYLYDANALTWDEILSEPGPDMRMRMIAKIMLTDDPLTAKARGAVGAYLSYLDDAMRKAGM